MHLAVSTYVIPGFQASLPLRGGIGVGYRSTCSDAAKHSHEIQHEIQDLATDIIEIDIGIAIRTRKSILEVGFERGALVWQTNC